MFQVDLGRAGFSLPSPGLPASLSSRQEGMFLTISLPESGFPQPSVGFMTVLVGMFFNDFLISSEISDAQSTELRAKLTSVRGHIATF